MLSASSDQFQFDMFSPILKSFIDPHHPLAQLADRLDWSQLEEEFASLYSDTGRPAHPIRLMVSLLLLKQMYGHGDESLPGVWVQNPYYQYLSGMDRFQWRFPVAPSDLAHFRARLGPEGIEKIFGWSVALHGGKAREKTLCVDTTVQETNISFPTDAKLYGKVMERLRGITKSSGIKLKQSYRFVGKQLLRGRFSASYLKKLPLPISPSWSYVSRYSDNEVTTRTKSTASTSRIPSALPRARLTRSMSLAGR